MAQWNSQAQRYLSNNDVLFEQVMLAGIDGKPSALSNGLAFDSFGRFRTSEPFTLFDSSHRYTDNGNWATSIVGSESASTHNGDQGLIDMIVGTEEGDSVYRETYKVFSYQPGKSLLVLNTAVFNEPKPNLRQRMGYFGQDNGVYLENDGEGTFLVKRTSVEGSVQDIRIPQTDWNVDTLTGTGISGKILDISKAQIFWMDFEWLGTGSVRIGFIIDGKIIHCHSFHHANLITSTYITSACLPLRYEIENTGGTNSSSTLKQICSSVISEGGYQLADSGLQRSISTPINTPRSLSAANTYYSVISVKLNVNKLDAIVLPTGLHAAPTGNAGVFHWRLIEDATNLGTGSWINLGAIDYKLHTESTAIEGGSVRATGYFVVSNQSSVVADLIGDALFKFQLKRNGLTDTAIPLTLAIASTVATTNSVHASIDLEEIAR